MQWETSKSPVITTRSVRYKFDVQKPYVQYSEPLPVPEDSSDTYVEGNYPPNLLPEEDYYTTNDETEADNFNENIAGPVTDLEEDIICNDEEQDIEVNNYIADFEEESTNVDYENNGEDDFEVIDEESMDLNDYSATEVTDNVSQESFVQNMNEMHPESNSEDLELQNSNLPSPLFYWNYPYYRASKNQPYNYNIQLRK